MEHRQLHNTSVPNKKPADYVDLTAPSPPASTRPLVQSTSVNRSAAPTPIDMSTYIRPAKAFAPSSSSIFQRPTYVDGWPDWVQPKAIPPKRVLDDGEIFDLDTAKISADDWTKHQGDAEAHMRELLSAAVGQVDEDIKDGEDVVEGFADGIRLMPHQVRGVRWMRGRETGRKFGGILADVSLKQKQS
jgi:hypothetical protein